MSIDSSLSAYVLPKRNGGIDDVDAARIRPCLAQFRRLVDGRNSLIHAHPITDLDGSQVLKHQGKHGRGGLTWAREEIDDFAAQVSEAACTAIEVRRMIVEEQEHATFGTPTEATP